MKAIVVCLLLAASAAAQTRGAAVAVFTTPVVQHAPSAKRVSLALTAAARELNTGGDLPKVAVFYIDRATAKIMQIDPKNEIAIVAATNHADALRTVYQVWVVDGATDTATALAVVQVLNVRFKLDLSAKQVNEVTQRVRSRMEQQIDVASLQ